MNLENINLLSQKVDGVLTTVRNLRQENATLKQTLATKEAEMQDRNLVLESLNNEINDCKAALQARANQAAAQDEAINQKQGEIDGLRGELDSANAKITDLQNMLDQTNGNLQNANEKISWLDAGINERDEKLNALQNDCMASKANESILNQKIEELNRIIAEKDNLIAERDNTIAEKDNAIDVLNTEKASLNETILAQGEEIREAQERFKQMVSTIENELGTEIPVDVAFNEQPAAQPEPEEAAQPEPAAPEQVAEPAAKEVAQPEPEPVAEPEQVAEPESHIVPAEDEEDIIEVHPANEKEPDLFASAGGSQPGFFG